MKPDHLQRRPGFRSFAGLLNFEIQVSAFQETREQIEKPTLSFRTANAIRKIPVLFTATQLVHIDGHSPDLGFGQAGLPRWHHPIPTVGDSLGNRVVVTTIEPDRIR